jgi:Zn-dependent protease
LNESYPIGRPFGIEVRVHILFLWMAFFLIFVGGNPLGTAAILFTLFGLVLLHELGHSLVARHHGIQVMDIVLWPRGGMARMSEIPESPRVEGQVAIAGPLVNLVLAAASLLLLGLLGGWGEAMGPSVAYILAHILESPTNFLRAFIAMNLMLGVFNLVPAFPMDGGRLLRAFLARKRSYLEATEIAVRVGRYIALAMILSVFFIQPMSCALPIIGVYIMWTGMRELWSVRLRHAGGGANPFGPGAGPMGGGPGGFRVDLSEHLRAFGRRGAQGAAPPESGRGDSSGRSAGGFSDEDLRRLEDEPGPLRRPPQD